MVVFHRTQRAVGALLLAMLAGTAPAADSQEVVLGGACRMLISDMAVYQWQLPEHDRPAFWEGRPVPLAVAMAEQMQGMRYVKNRRWYSPWAHVELEALSGHMVWSIRAKNAGVLHVQAEVDLQNGTASLSEVSGPGQVKHLATAASGSVKGALSVAADQRVRVRLDLTRKDRSSRATLNLLKITLAPQESGDTDHDGLSSKVEQKVLGSASDCADTDGDGLSDYEEVMITNTRFDCSDTDGDGLSDLMETCFGSDPRRADTDDDGLGDLDEYAEATCPWTADTDGDGVSDGDEMGYSSPLLADTDNDGRPDAQDDKFIRLRQAIDQYQPAALKPGQLRGVHVYAVPGLDEGRGEEFIQYLSAFSMNFVMPLLDQVYADQRRPNADKIRRHMKFLRDHQIRVIFLCMRPQYPYEEIIPVLMEFDNFLGLCLDEPTHIERFFPWATRVNRIAGRRIAMVNFSQTLCETEGENWQEAVGKAYESKLFEMIWADPYNPAFFPPAVLDDRIDGLLPYLYEGLRSPTGPKPYRSGPLAMKLTDRFLKAAMVRNKHICYYNINRFMPEPEQNSYPWQPPLELIQQTLNPGAPWPALFHREPYGIAWRHRVVPPSKPVVLNGAR